MARLSLTALGIALATCLCAAQGSASTISDSYSFFNSSNNIVASGSFSYDSSHSGLLTYDDLNTFTITLAGQTYDLGFVGSVSNYKYFGYDTASNSFIPTSVPGTFGPFDGILAALNDDDTDGFFVTPLDSGGEGVIGKYGTNARELIWTSYSVAQTPIPAALPLFASALAGLGFAGWRRKRAAAA
jgi:hypothetical protein